MKTENIIIIAAHPTSHRLTHRHTYYLYPIIMLHRIAWFLVGFVDRSLQLCFGLVWN